MTARLSVARLPPRRRRRLSLVVLVVLLALLLLLSNLVPLVAEWLWFQALGYERVFTTRLVAEALLGVGVGGLVFAFLYLNLRIAQRGLVPNPLVVQFSAGAAAVDVTRLVRRLALPVALGVALLFGDRKSTRLNSSHDQISYAVFCLKKKKNTTTLPSAQYILRRSASLSSSSWPQSLSHEVVRIIPTECSTNAASHDDLVA